MPKIGNRLVRWWATFCVVILGVVTGGALAYGLGLLVSGFYEIFAWGFIILGLIITVSIVLGIIVHIIDQLGDMLFDSAAATAEKEANPSSS